MNVYTLPQYLRKGIAGNLMQMAISDAKLKNLSFIELKATKAGYSLYQKLGFVHSESTYVPMKYIISHKSPDRI